MRITSSNANKETNFSGSVITFYKDDKSEMYRLQFPINHAMRYVKQHPKSEIARRFNETKKKLEKLGW